MSHEASVEILRETAERLFAAHVGEELRLAAERGQWPAALWEVVAANGFDRPHAMTEGTAWGEAAVLLRAAGRACAPVPLAETMVAAWILARAGLEDPGGVLTLAAAQADDDVLPRTPWARHAAHVVVVRSGDSAATVQLFALRNAAIVAGENLAHEPRDHVDLGGSPALAEARWRGEREVVGLYGAMARTAQMAGALEALVEMSVRYARERVQFGRPIAQFQAIQQELARLAGFAAEAGVAADAAFAAAGRYELGELGERGEPGADVELHVAAAKVVAGDAAEHAPRIAHQVHGAIGFTYEHALHFATRRLWAWRAEYGSAHAWAERLGRRAYDAGADGLWPLVTRGASGRDVGR